MTRSFWLPFGIFLLLVAAPSVTHAAIPTTFTPLIPQVGSGGICDCTSSQGGSAPDWGCVLQTIQTGFADLMLLATIIITIFIAWAGISYLMAPINAEAKGKARQRIVNAVIGLVIVLCAWLLIDSLLKVIYNNSATVIDGTANGTTGQAQLGPWNAILSGASNSYCISVRTQTYNLPGLGLNNGLTASQLGSGQNPAVTASSPSSVTPVTPVSGAGACSSSNVQSAAAQGGVQMSTAEASTLACIAVSESSCGAANLNSQFGKPVVGSQSSSAAGPFQILIQTGSPYYNNPACASAAAAAGYPGATQNCRAGFSNGYAISGSTIATGCEDAAANLACSATTAYYTIQQNGYKPWNSPADESCIAKYSGT